MNIHFFVFFDWMVWMNEYKHKSYKRGFFLWTRSFFTQFSEKSYCITSKESLPFSLNITQWKVTWVHLLHNNKPINYLWDNARCYLEDLCMFNIPDRTLLSELRNPVEESPSSPRTLLWKDVSWFWYTPPPSSGELKSPFAYW